MYLKFVRWKLSKVRSGEIPIRPTTIAYMIQECFQHTVMGGCHSEEVRLTTTLLIVGVDQRVGDLVIP